MLSVGEGDEKPLKYPLMFRRAPRGAAGGMRAAVLRAMAGFAALVALLFFAIPVQADEIEPEPESESESEPAPQAEPEPEPEPVPVPDVVSEEEEFSEPAWIPSLDVGFEGFSYDVDTTIVNLRGVSPQSETQVESVNQLVFRIGGELMGPMFEDLPGRPRLFVQGGVGFSTFADELFERGDPGLLNEPEANIGIYDAQGAGENDFPFDFEGQGSRLDASLQDPSWYAGLGIAFSVQTSGGMLFYIKPSVQYSLEEIDFRGNLTTVEETSPPGTVDPDPCGREILVPPPDPPEPPETPAPLCNRTFEVHRSNASSSTTDHSIGPGLEVAMAFRSFRPIRISIFAQARALWLISDSTTSFTDPNGIASYSVERDDLSIRGGAGIRVRWVGFD